MTDNRSIRRKLFQVYNRQEWLAASEKQIYALLDICKNSGQINLVFDLLQRFEYFSSIRTGIASNAIVHHIIHEFELAPEETQIVAMTEGRSPDSGQVVIYNLKPPLAANGWNDVTLINQTSKAVDLVIERPNIVLVDEFAGTGQTIQNRIQLLRTRIADKAHNKKIVLDPKFYVCLYAAMNNAIDNFRTLVTDVFCQCILRPGITGYYNNQELCANVGRMLALEAQFEQTADFPSFGYGKAEALYCRESGNAPNSVFPIFWWDKLLGNQDFEPLLLRWDQ